METPNRTDCRTAVVNDMPPQVVAELLELAQAAPIQIIVPPRSGLTMMQVRDAFDSEFLLGEVLVTAAEVAMDGIHGFGMVPGDEPDRALARACAEVLLLGPNQLLKARVQKVLEREQEQLEGRRRSENQLIAGTKVHFELMAGN